MEPLMVVFRATLWAVVSLVLGSFSATSFRSPTTKARGLLTPHLLTRRTSSMPRGALAGTVTLYLTEPMEPAAMPGRGRTGGFLGSGLGGGGAATSSALTAGLLKTSFSGSSRFRPVQVTSTVEPALAPQGETTSRLGAGRPEAGRSWARPS